MPRCTSHGPRSAPARTTARGAGTSVAPLPHASHISSQLASKETESPASTRSSARTLQSRCSAATKAAAERWLTATPFGLPVEPEVKMTQASSRRIRLAAFPLRGAQRTQLEPLLEHSADVGLAPDLGRARGRIVGIHRHVRGTRAEHRDDPDVELRGAAFDVDPDALARPHTPCAQGARHAICLGGELRVGVRAVFRVERAGGRIARDRRLEQVDERAGLFDRGIEWARPARGAERWRMMSIAAMAAFSKHFGTFLFPSVRFTLR